MLIAKHEGSGSNVTQAGGVGIYMVSDEEPGGGLASSDAIRYLQEDQQIPIVELIINQPTKTGYWTGLNCRHLLVLCCEVNR